MKEAGESELEAGDLQEEDLVGGWCVVRPQSPRCTEVASLPGDLLEQLTSVPGGGAWTRVCLLPKTSRGRNLTKAACGDSGEGAIQEVSSLHGQRVKGTCLPRNRSADMGGFAVN